MTDLEVYEAPQVERHQSGHSIGDLAMLADRIARTGMVPQAFRGKPDEILAVFLYGNECGLPVMQSLQLIDMIQGRPTLNAQGQRALILGAGHQFWIEESSPTSATAVGIRKGTDREVRATFTIEEARAAGLLSKAPWKNNPEDMLVARATTRLARRSFSDVTLGLAYDAEELGGGVHLAHDAQGGAQPELAPTAPQPLTNERIDKFYAYCKSKGVDGDDVVKEYLDGDSRSLTSADVAPLAKLVDKIAAEAAQAASPDAEQKPQSSGAGSSVGEGKEEAVAPPSASSNPGGARGRFFALVSARWPDLPEKDREMARHAFVKELTGDESTKGWNREQFNAAADLLQEQIDAGQQQSLLDSEPIDAEVVG